MNIEAFVKIAKNNSHLYKYIFRVISFKTHFRDGWRLMHLNLKKTSLQMIFVVVSNPKVYTQHKYLSVFKIIQ
jgi:hypothetical protein